MTFTRLAIYHMPEGDLGEFGSAWLGWDARRAATVPRPQIDNLPASPQELTSTPMRYGFHATLKAPFRLAAGHDLDDLMRQIELVCDHLAPFTLDLELRADWSFVALRPRNRPAELMALEQALVTRLDHLRAPLSPQERDRRNPDKLPERARMHLEHWGYPFVLDLFNYHLTLSNSLSPETEEQLREALAPVIAPLIAEPMPVRSVALLGEDKSRHMRVIREFPLLGRETAQ
ncbi:DUF1045 domain-containing protein [Paracoccus sp. MBLB3053]|uniref:DUF1045 domain-containing protein n=1 Tax=Paracoccus aurantius TaxID=3073814 RepID=A0ABU2HM96_9RHOB|nr:DUF1045 domain-containing protein [Paracoccus sp. MBLB3053]MDS9466163.1 DUF1045 domain-containing protein [Paracoccus sp. MBLB3053]